MASSASTREARRHVPQNAVPSLEPPFPPRCQADAAQTPVAARPDSASGTGTSAPSNWTEAKLYHQGKELVISRPPTGAPEQLPPGGANPAGAPASPHRCPDVSDHGR